MRNPYALIPPQPHAGLVCENVAFCKKSDEHLVRKQIEAQGGEEVVFTIEDHMEDDMMQMLARVNSYRLEGNETTFDANIAGYAELTSEECKKVYSVDLLDPKDGCRKETLLMLASSEEQGLM